MTGGDHTNGNVCHEKTHTQGLLGHLRVRETHIMDVKRTSGYLRNRSIKYAAALGSFSFGWPLYCST